MKATYKIIQDDINWSELSRHITKGDRNRIRANKIPKKHREALRKLFNEELPEWWNKFQPSKRGLFYEFSDMFQECVKNLSFQKAESPIK